MSLEKFLASDGDGCFIVGHSSALFKMGGHLVLCDPVWDSEVYGPMWKFIPEQVNCDDVLDRAYCFVSHGHRDHMCPDVLERVRRGSWIMDGRPEFTEAMKKFGRVTRVPNYQWTTVAHNLEAYFVPHPTNGVDSSFFLRTCTAIFYFGNDNFLTREILERVRADVPFVDVALLPFAYISWWPFLQEGIDPKFKQSEIARMNSRCLRMAWDFMDVFKPALSVPFGASIYYNDSPDHPLNKWVAKPSDLSGATPMYAGDYVVGGKVFAEKFDHEKLVQESLNRKSVPLDFAFDHSKFDWARLEEKIARAPRLPFGHALCVNGVSIQSQATRMSEKVTHVTEFNFDKQDVHLWATGHATFEELIGRRRFEFRRTPDEHNPEVIAWANRWL